MAHRIAEAAELSGVPASAIRYYEDQGLLRPAVRADNGYRTYDDRDVARLRFVGRVRALDLPVEEMAELVELWDGDRCGPVADRLREHVTDHLADTQRRLADLAALAGELQQVLARLQAPAHDGPCVEGECVCADDGTSAPVAMELPMVDEAVVACTLDHDRMPDRMADWQRVLARARRQDPVPGGVALTLPVEPALVAEATALAAAEQGCCSFFAFSLDVTADAVVLRVTGPEDAQPLIAAVFGAPGAAPAASAS